MKTLVTGGAGFIGQHLCRSLLSEGHEVVSIDREISSHSPSYRLDITDIYTLDRIIQQEKPGMIFHMAANSDIRAGIKDSDIDFTDTLMTTHQILRVMQKHNIKKILFASSSAVYGESIGLLLENRDIPDPISYYGAAKLASEGFIRAATELNGVQAWICRFSNIVGQGMTHGVIFDLFNKLQKNPKELEVLGNGEQTKPYLHVSDLIEAMLFIWKNSNESYNLYNIGPDTTTKVKDIVRILLEETKISPTVHYMDSERGWPGDVPNFRYNTARLTHLGWKAKLTSDEAIRLAIRESI